MPTTHLPAESDPADYDGRWKDALDAYFEPCLHLFWPSYDETDVRRLFTFIDGVLTLPPALEPEFTAALDEIEGDYEVTYITSVERVGIRKGLQQGLEQGFARGREDGLKRALLAQLERRFGPVPAPARERIEAASTDAVQDWLLRVLDAPTLDEVLR